MRWLIGVLTLAGLVSTTPLANATTVDITIPFNPTSDSFSDHFEAGPESFFNNVGIDRVLNAQILLHPGDTLAVTFSNLPATTMYPINDIIDAAINAPITSFSNPAFSAQVFIAQYTGSLTSTTFTPNISEGIGFGPDQAIAGFNSFVVENGIVAPDGTAIYQSIAVDFTLNATSNPFYVDELELDTFSSFPGAAPEPSTWAMLLIGFTAIGSAGYRRRQKLYPTVALC